MAKRAARSSIQLEWFNVSYRSVYSIVVLALLLVVGGIGAWYYYFRYAPNSRAAAALEKAEQRYAEAALFRADSRVEQIVAGAEAALEQARVAQGAGSYDAAQVNALRSEELSLKVLGLVKAPTGEERAVHFYRIEGDVRVKKAGEFSWEPADKKTVLHQGDQVKTASSGSAQLIYFDRTITAIEPGSLLEVRDLYEDPLTRVRKVSEKLSWGQLVASTQKRNVAGSFHEVATEKLTARADDAGEFRVAVDKEQKIAVFDVFQGKIEVASPAARESLVAGERIRASEQGRFLAKETLPGVPRLVSPADERVFVFEQTGENKITLSWEPVPGSARYHLMIADKPLFTDPLYDDRREENSVVVEGVPAGAYHWRVATVSNGGVQGPFSEPRRFRVSAGKIRDRSDTVPPELQITEFVPVGGMVIINGRTEPGASLWVDSEKVEVSDDGTFYAVVRLRKEGLNELKLLAQDTAGNESRVSRTAYVELY
ncbi:MAG TPA: hypothetical protein VJS92_07795 [Candidatus Polarisedimenticolaceae bacterium]|nr:hypothetical protein [Candidatus Polarisedimenticolaceae bacterium]